MLTFYNEKGEGFGAQVEFTVKNAVNGERSVSGTIISNDRVLSGIDIGWKFELNGEFFTIVFAKPRDEGRNLSVSFDAVHQFFYDFEHSNCYSEFNGSHRFEVYIEAIFKNSGYRYQIEPSVRVNSIRKENFGNAKRLEMFKDIIKAAGLEFSVSGKVVLITKKIGSDLSTVVRKNFNMNELVIEKNINKFITYKRGFGAWKDEEDHSKGRYTSEYESPLARIYGRIEGEPVTDERYKDTGKLLERLKSDVDNSYSISVQLDMEDLTRAGYQYTQPRAGDYIMAINETTGFREKIRIVSFESSYDVMGRLINHKVTCNDIGSVQKQISSESSILRNVGQSKEYAESALAVATRALVSADGKNTVYYGATKPKDEPIGTIRRGDILYLTAGEDTEMYIWNGAEWELKKLKLDTTELEKEFDKVKKAAEQASAESKATAEEALKKAGTSADLAEQVKGLVDTTRQNLDTFKSQAYNNFVTDNQLRSELSTAKTELKKYVKEETDEKTSAIRETIANGFVAKSTYLENVEGINQRFENLKRDNEAKLADYKQGIDGRFANIASQMAGKVNQIDFQRVRETAQLYERILGGAENDVSNNVSRLVMSNQIFQTEVGKYVTDDNNLIVNSLTMDKHSLVNQNRNGVDISVSDGIFTLKANGLTSYNFSGFTLPIYVKKIYRGETYTLGFKYRIRKKVDTNFVFTVKNHVDNKALLSADMANANTPASDEWQEFQRTFTVQEDFTFGEDPQGRYPFYIYIAKNGWIEFKEPILVRGSKTGPYKPSQFDDAYKMAEVTRTQVTQLADSWAVRSLNSAGDILGQLNLNKDGSVHINEALVAVGDKTYIKDGVIKKSMIGNAQIGTAHIGEIDASQARLINVSAKNIVAEGLTANIIRGGKLSSLNGQSDFDLQTGWLEMNQAGVGIKNQFAGRPLQYLVFGQGSLYGKPGSYTALMSNSRGEVKMNDASAGIQIWNTPDNTTAVNVYGDRIDFMYNANDPLSIGFDTIHNTIENVEDIGLKGKSLATVLNDIFWNFRVLSDGGANLPYHFFKYWNGDK
nr:MAG TPA: tail protein [Caudoviricetes sp.]